MHRGADFRSALPPTPKRTGWVEGNRASKHQASQDGDSAWPDFAGPRAAGPGAGERAATGAGPSAPCLPRTRARPPLLSPLGALAPRGGAHCLPGYSSRPPGPPVPRSLSRDPRFFPPTPPLSRWWRSSPGDSVSATAGSFVSASPSCALPPARSLARPLARSFAHSAASTPPRLLSTWRGRWRLLPLLLGVARLARTSPWPDPGSSRAVAAAATTTTPTLPKAPVS